MRDFKDAQARRSVLASSRAHLRLLVFEAIVNSFNVPMRP